MTSGAEEQVGLREEADANADQAAASADEADRSARIAKSRELAAAAGGLVYDSFISYSHAADDLVAPERARLSRLS